MKPSPKRRRNDRRARTEHEDMGMVRALVPEGPARRAAEHELRRQQQRLIDLERQRQRRREVEESFKQNILISAFAAQTGTDANLIRPDSVRMRVSPSGTYLLNATIEVEIAPETWADHFSPLLVPFSGPVTYDAHPAPTLPPPRCASPTPPSYGRGECELPKGHTGAHAHNGKTWAFTVRR